MEPINPDKYPCLQTLIKCQLRAAGGPFLFTGEKSMSEPLSGSGTAAALGGATVFGLFTGTD
ncbi:phage holin family protein, partial [Escherichia coli]|nr:phage holin family protein [Escherichia coli]